MILLSTQLTNTIGVDLTVTISAILGCAAVISPIFVTIINGVVQYKMRKLELQQERYKREVIRKQRILENFIRSLDACLYCHDDESLKSFGEYYPLAYMLVPDDVRKTMFEVHFHVYKQNWDEVRKYIDSLSTDVHKTIMELQQPRRRFRHKSNTKSGKTHP